MLARRKETGERAGGQGVAAVDRAVRILRVFRQGEPSLSLAEIARRTGLYKSTILRLAATLGEHELLLRAADGVYRLGPALLEMGSIYQGSFRLQDVLVPAMTELMRATGESVRFYIRQGDRRVLLFSVDSPQSLREHILAGQSVPLDTTSTGRVFRSMEKPAAATRARFPIHTSGIKDPLTSSCAAPLLTGDGIFLGVIAVSGPTARFTLASRRMAGKKLTETTARLAAQLRGLSLVS
jgi:DNA-binding IclR family transcriptional regulator